MNLTARSSYQVGCCRIGANNHKHTSRDSRMALLRAVNSTPVSRPALYHLPSAELLRRNDLTASV